MRSTRRTGVLAIATSLALTAVAIPSTGIAAGIVPDTGVQAVAVTPGETPPPPELVPAGKLVLSTVNGAPGSGKVELLDVNGNPVGVPQNLSESGTDTCKGLGGADGTLLKFTGFLNEGPAGATNRVGFSKGSIGVKETSSEQFCNQIDTTSTFTALTKKFTPETLVLALPSGDGAISDPDFGPLKATSASLDVELRNANSRILVTASLGGLPTAYYELRTGGFATQEPAPANIPVSNPNASYDVTELEVAKDANVPWLIGNGTDGVTFDTLSIRAYNGGVSLEGKADPEVTAATSIELGYEPDKVLTCDGTIVSGTATVQYIGNASSTDCQAGFSAVLSGTDEEVRFLKPLTVSPDAQFIFDINWKVANTGGTPSPTIPDTLIDFEIGGDPEETPLLFCSESDTAVLARNETTGDLEIVSFAKFNEDDTAFPDFDGDSLEQKEFACIDTRTEIGITPEFVTYTDKVFAIGDLRMKAGG